MLEVRRDPDLAQKALGAEHRGELRLQHLDRDVAAVAEVVGEVHRGHAAGAELPRDPVALGECGRQARGDVAHLGETIASVGFTVRFRISS